MPDSRAIKYIIVPYRKGKSDALLPGEIRQASSEVNAIRIANAMASSFVGVAAYEVLVDEETGEMNSPRILVQEGSVPALGE
ncbi:hypothetical protein OR16_22403 [Cupriavidus basilensis OR16]|uniref:Uncharacterized protein n=1 Tax=Cupriavidus basilensis OR16 TaxID=1127483 RepID=H1S905_9BURK|nr:hypothetical protein [Cupriavidus basilensis]EHP41021.1 hypothetical protein OR16_22403 [Cupriavidus basilensis OR16]